MAKKTAIDLYVNKILDDTPKNKAIFFAYLKSQLSKIINTIYMDSISGKKRNDGYCVLFAISDQPVLKLLENTKYDFTTNDLSQVFATVWSVPMTAKMYNNPYYITLMFFSLVCIRAKQEHIAKDLVLLCLLKIWNGRRTSAFPHYCDADIMRYVISEMSYQYNARKYETPYLLLSKYFTPTIYKKYSNSVLHDSHATKRFFEACFNRIRQIFRSSKEINLLNVDDTKVKYTSGLQPLYYDAAEKQKKIVTNIGNSDSTLDDIGAVGNSDDLLISKIGDITSSIIHNLKPVYPSSFIHFLRTQSREQIKILGQLVTTLHHPSNEDDIYTILQNIFGKMDGLKKENICDSKFYDEIRVNIIASKNNPHIFKIRVATDSILERSFMSIFHDDKYFKQYQSFYNTKQSQLRRVIIYTIIYNLKLFVCK